MSSSLADAPHIEVHLERFPGANAFCVPLRVICLLDELWHPFRMMRRDQSAGRARQGRQRARRLSTGALALLLLGVTSAASLWLAEFSHLGVPAVTVTILGGIPGLYLAWAALKTERRREAHNNLNLSEVADHLASAVRDQWTDEAGMRRLNDPYPLPVSWVAADAALMDDWEVIQKLASSGVGWPSPPPTGDWATGPMDLAGCENDIVDVLNSVPTGRLVVLGEPGAGKSMLMVRLLLDLLVRRASGGPVPVLVSLASWNPADKVKSLKDWFAEQLYIAHPALNAEVSAGARTQSLVDALLHARLIIPILDGLDEIPEAGRRQAIAKMNDSPVMGGSFVVTCRTEQYRKSVRPIKDAEVTLRAAAAVELSQLDAESVGKYLTVDARPTRASLWAPVLQSLGTQSPAGQALTTPLMIALARTIFNPRPGEDEAEANDPGHLCDPRLADRPAVESYLFDGFITATYRGQSGRWTMQQIERWLAFLARHLEYKIKKPNYAWWELYQAVPEAVLVAGMTVTVALSSGLGLWLLSGPVVGALTFLLVSTVSGSILAEKEHSDALPSPGVEFRIVRSAWAVALICLAGIYYATSRPVGNWLTKTIPALFHIHVTPKFIAQAESPTFGLGVSSFIVLIATGAVGITLVAGITSKPGFLAEATDPAESLQRDRSAAVQIILAAALLAGISGSLVLGTKHGSIGFVEGFFGGAAIGISGGLLFSIWQTSWLAYLTARAWLTLRHQIPLGLPAFLADAHQRTVLRQEGALYQFRHLELQARLAHRPLNDSS